MSCSQPALGDNCCRLAGVGDFLPLAGGTMTGTAGVVFPDNFNLKIGTGSDLKIFHNATDSFIINEVGDLKITQGANDKDIVFESDNGSGGTTEYLRISGQYEQVYLRKDMQVSDGKKIMFGDSVQQSGDLQIYHNGSNSFIETTSTSTGDFYITARGTNHDLYLEAADDIYIRPQGNESGIDVIGNGAVNLYHNNVLQLNTTSTGISTNTIDATVAAGSAGNFVVMDGTRLAYRTAAQVLSDIGGTSSSGVTSVATTAPILGGTITSTGTISLRSPVSGNWHNGGAPVVGTDGLMEIGRYIDFHTSNTGTSDYDVRLNATSGLLTVTGSVFIFIKYYFNR